MTGNTTTRRKIRERDLDEKLPARSHEYFHRFHFRLQWGLLIAFLAPLAIVAFYFGFQLDSTHKKSVKLHLLALAESLSNTIDLFLEERAVNIFSLFHSRDFSVQPKTEDMEQRLQSLRHASDAFVDVGFFNAQGVQIGYAGPYPHLEGRDYSGEQWFSQLIGGTRDFSVSDVYLGFRERPHFSIAVQQRIDRETYVVRATLDPRNFYLFLQDISREEGIDAALINEQGLFQAVNPQTGKLLGKSEFVPTTEDDGRARETVVNGEGVVLACVFLKETPWSLIVKQPLTLAYAESRRGRYVLIAVALLIVVVIVILIRMTTNRLLLRAEATARSREELQSELLHAAKLASVGELAAGVAHEINNPLAIIGATSGVLRDMMDPELSLKWSAEAATEELDTIDAAVMRGRGITSQLMNFSRKNTPQLDSCNLNEILDGVLEGFIEHELSVSGVQLVRDYEARLPEVLVDPDQCRQVFLNLINNAADAIEGKNGTITLSTRGDGDNVRVTVVDNGKGIEPQNIERVFLPFFSTKEVGKGTGLGLSVSLGIVESMGGSMEVQSAVDVGSAFTVIMPVPGTEAMTEARTEALTDEESTR
jgi:two-component system NtrC family sensor kinase